MSRQRGFVLAMISVLLVSGAQLAMRWGMVRLPTPEHLLSALETRSLDTHALAWVLAAIVAYGLSMLCWLIALRSLALSRAYSLLSLSYALVYLTAAFLPIFNETPTVPRTVGVTLIVLGVATINLRRSSDLSGKELSR